MLSLTRRCLQQQGRIPSAGSSLLNPNSNRAKVRRAMAMHEAGQRHFDEQVLFANIGGDGGSEKRAGRSTRRRRSSPQDKSKGQRKAFHVLLTGQQVAERARYITDSEWEGVSSDDKHAFARYMSKLLRERPTEATEQQRRRYFETTMADPRDLDPNTTVRDSYERLKMGLPVQLKNPQRALGVSQAVYESAEASLFDPANVHKLESAMTDVKQTFADYVSRRRAGTSTEQQRRQLANHMAELNVETQKHLASMFKYAEERLRAAAQEERERQLGELARLKTLVARGPAHPHRKATPPPPETAAAQDDPAEVAAAAAAPTHGERLDAPPHPQPERPHRRRHRHRHRLTTEQRKAKLTASISRAVGLDVAVAASLLEELDAQERFLRFCEVLARLTVGRGFSHTRTDEGLDEYTESLRTLYSVDAQKLSTLDAVQYMAAKEGGLSAVEWARRWYESALLIPLQQTPEYKRLQAIQEADQQALELRRSVREERKLSSEQSSSSGATGPAGAESAGEPATDAGDGTAAALELSATAARTRQDKTVRLVEKMFLRPDDARLETLHEKRLRYLAYLQMERQITQARENARVFAGVEDSPEAERCRLLYQQLRERKALLLSTTGADTVAAEPPDEATSAAAAAAPPERSAAPANVFTDATAAALFDELRGITEQVIARVTMEHRQAAVARVRSRAAERADRLAALVRGVAAGSADDLRSALDAKRREVAGRLLSVAERDVRAEMEWLEAMQEAERPPLLPLPQGMSYVSAAEVAAWQDLRDSEARRAANPFEKTKRQAYQPTLLGQSWRIPDKPMLFWGTGTRAVQQALQHAADDANRKRRGQALAPPYPCPENPWGWRLVKDILDD